MEWFEFSVLHGVDHFFAYTFGMDAVKEVLSWKLGHKDPFRCSICGVCISTRWFRIALGKPCGSSGPLNFDNKIPQDARLSVDRLVCCRIYRAILKNNSGGGPEYNFQSLSLRRSGWQLGDFFAMAQAAFVGAVGAARKRPSSKLPQVHLQRACCLWCLVALGEGLRQESQHQHHPAAKSMKPWELRITTESPARTHRLLEKLVANAPSLEQAIERRFDQKLPALLKRLSEAAPDSRLSR